MTVLLLGFQAGSFSLLFQGDLGVSMAFSKVRWQTYLGDSLVQDSSDTDNDSFMSMGAGFGGEIALSDAAALFFGLGFGYPFDDDWEDWYGGALVDFGFRFGLSGGNILGLGLGYKFTGDPEYPVLWGELEAASVKIGEAVSPYFSLAWRRHAEEHSSGGAIRTVTSRVTNDFTVGMGLRARVGLTK